MDNNATIIGKKFVGRISPDGYKESVKVGFTIIDKVRCAQATLGQANYDMYVIVFDQQETAPSNKDQVEMIHSFELAKCKMIR